MVRNEMDNNENFAVYIKRKEGNEYIGDAVNFRVVRGSKKAMPRLMITPAKYDGNFESSEK